MLSTQNSVRPVLTGLKKAATSVGGRRNVAGSVRTLSSSAVRPQQQRRNASSHGGGPLQSNSTVSGLIHDLEFGSTKHNHGRKLRTAAVGDIRGGPVDRLAFPLFDGKNHAFDSIFLRDSCTCPLCIDPSNKQKLFQTSDIPQKIRGYAEESVDSHGRPGFRIVWSNDVPGYPRSHTTHVSSQWLQNTLKLERDLQKGLQEDFLEDRVYWDREIMERDNKWVEYGEYMKDDRVLFDTLKQLSKYGLVFLRGVPEDEKSVEHIVDRIGLVRETFYGKTFDVKSKPNAKNIAYTHQFLGLHMDLLYMTNPPHLQLLHSLRAQSPGGESLFSDTFHAAQQLSPQQFHSLATYPVTYHYHNDSQHYRRTAPTIVLAESPSATTSPRADVVDPVTGSATHPTIDHVNFSPPFQGRLSADIGSAHEGTALRNYLSAIHEFEKQLSSEDSVFEYRLAEGECVIFDNRRVLHARRAFDAEKGERWLKGAYVDNDVFWCRLRVLGEMLEGKRYNAGT